MKNSRRELLKINIHRQKKEGKPSSLSHAIFKKKDLLYQQTRKQI